MGSGKEDTLRPGAWLDTVVVLEERGLVASKDQDGAFRVWKIPEK
jgi:hypothetical protein